MIRYARLSAFVFSLLAAQWMGAQPTPAQACRNVEGRLVSQVVPIGQLLSDGSPCDAAPGLFCTSGRLTGGLAGTFDFAAKTFDPAANPDFASTGTGFFTGRLVVHTNHGDVTFRDAGAIAADSGALTFASVLTIVEGTDALAGATGRIRDEGIFINGCVDCRYRGEVCTPGAGQGGR